MYFISIIHICIVCRFSFQSKSISKLFAVSSSKSNDVYQSRLPTLRQNFEYSVNKSPISQTSKVVSKEILSLLCSANFIGVASTLYITTIPCQYAEARNIPENLGASRERRGTSEGLLPIVNMRNAIDNSLQALPDIKSCKSYLSTIPNSEKQFKKIFDEYSQEISYKQKFLDQNAFLVYYTAGFDGPGRPRIDSEDSTTTKTTLQYGFRNDAWIAFDDALSEITYIIQSPSTSSPSGDDMKELQSALKSACIAFDQYLKLANPQDLDKATNRN